MDKKALGGLMTSAGFLVGQMREYLPDSLEAMITAAFILWLADLVTGSVVAAKLGRLSSRDARTKALAKSGQYFGLVAIGLALTVASGMWGFIYAMIAIVCWSEFLSIGENIICLESIGVSMRLAKPILKRINRWFENTVNAAFPDEPGATPGASGGAPATTISPKERVTA